MNISEAKKALERYADHGTFKEIQAIGVVLLDILETLEQLKKWR